MQDRKVWNADERELIGLRARQLRRQSPDIGFVKLFELSQDVLPVERRRKYHNKAFDLWIIDASFTPSAYELASALADRIAEAATGGESVLKSLGVFLGVTDPATRSGSGIHPATDDPGDPADDPKNGGRKNIGRNQTPPNDRQAKTRTSLRHLYNSISKRPATSLFVLGMSGIC